MLAVRNPFASGSKDILPQPARKPLQLRNTNALNFTVAKVKSAVKRDDAPKRMSQAEDSVVKDEPKESEEIGEREWNKENIPVMVEGLDSSLGAELIEMRKRAERLKFDKEETEKRLKERDNVFEVWRENTKRRSEEQRKLEAEMDRIFRITDLRALTRISPVKSLREKEAPLSILKWAEDDMEESVGDNSAGSPDRKNTGHLGNLAENLELGSVSAESRC